MKKYGVPGLACLLMAATVHATDLKDQLLATDKALWSAWGKKDGQPYKKWLTEDAMYIIVGAPPIQGRDTIANEVENNPCTREKFSIENVSLRHLAPTIVELSYDAQQTAECDGTEMPAKVRATSIYVKQGARWLVTLFQETPIELE
jgi:uncharacterized protein (TIGR02246 family)